MLSNETFVARYNLEDSEIKNLEATLVDRVKDQVKNEDLLYSVWLSPNIVFSNVIRTYEARVFPEITNFVSDEVEANSDFLALVDLRNSERVVHAFRVSGLRTLETKADANASSGFILVDEIIESGQISKDEFVLFYSSRGVELDRCIAVETNFRIGERAPDYNGLTIAEVGYVALFKQIQKMGLETDKSAVFANLNIAAVKSLGKVGLEFKHLMENEDIRTPSSEEEFDEHYSPVCIPSSERNLEIFQGLISFAANELEFTA